MNRRVLKIVGIVILGVAAIGLFGLFSNQQAKGAATTPDWPAFEMVYEDWGINRGINSSGGFIRTKLTYTDRRHWRSEILFESTKPELSGEISEHTPTALTSYNPRTNKSNSIAIAPGEPIYGADDWLWPGQVSAWVSRYNATVTPTDKPGIVQMTYTEQTPCDPAVYKDVFKCEAPVYEVVTEIKYWADHDVPMELKVTSNGKVTRHITVTEFRWLNK